MEDNGPWSENPATGTKQKKITYPIPGSSNGGSLFLYGDPNSRNIAILSAGFPDDQDVFLPFASRLATETNAMVGVTCLPGYSAHKSWKENWTSTGFKKNGYTLDEMSSSFREAVKALLSESVAPDEAKLTGIFHDWGVIPGLMWSNRALVEEDEKTKKNNGDDKQKSSFALDRAPDELVIFDVLTQPHPEMNADDLPKGVKDPTLYEKFITYFYRLVFVVSFLIQRYVSNILACTFFIFGSITMNVFRIGPTLSIDAKVFSDRKPPPSLGRVIYMCYPYYYMFKSLFQDGKLMEDSSLPKDLGRTPVLYLYGTEKRIHFHDNLAVKMLERERDEKRSKSDAVAVENAGHYLYVQQEDVCLERVKKFMMATK